MRDCVLPQATFSNVKPSNFKLAVAPLPIIEDPYPDLAYVQAHFTFDTKVAHCTGVVNLVAAKDGVFRAWTLSTVLEGLKDFPEVGREDGHISSTDTWQGTRDKKAAFVDEEPEVVIGEESLQLSGANSTHQNCLIFAVGAGHNGLVLAARLQALGVKVLILEANKRVGDNWRNRYEALSLHFPVWQGEPSPYRHILEEATDPARHRPPARSPCSPCMISSRLTTSRSGCLVHPFPEAMAHLHSGWQDWKLA